MSLYKIILGSIFFWSVSTLSPMAQNLQKLKSSLQALKGQVATLGTGLGTTSDKLLLLQFKLELLNVKILLQSRIEQNKKMHQNKGGGGRGRGRGRGGKCRGGKGGGKNLPRHTHRFWFLFNQFDQWLTILSTKPLAELKAAKPRIDELKALLQEALPSKDKLSECETYRAKLNAFLEKIKPQPHHHYPHSHHHHHPNQNKKPCKKKS